MAVEVKRQSDLGVAHDRLNAFGRPFKVGDEEAGRGVAQQMEVIGVLGVPNLWA